MASLPPVRTKVGADVGAFKGGINAAVATLGSFTGGLGTAGVALGAFIGAKGIGAAIGAFSEFDAKMTESQAIMGELSQQTMADMERAALQVSRTTLKSAEEAAESYFFLASAGLDAEQSIAALPQVAAFAQAGMFDMATATDLATDAQSALGLTVEDTEENLRNLTRVTDVFVRANQLANATVQQFSESITNKLGARLRNLDKPIEEGVAGLAALADQGVKGRLAGRGLNIVLRDLQSQAVRSAAAFDEMNIRVFDQQGEMRNLADIVEDFEAALGDASDQQKAAAFETLNINRRAADYLNTLIGLSDEIRDYEKQLRDAGGATEEVADKQVQTLSRQMELLGSEIKASAIATGGFVAELLNLQENAGLIRGDIQGIRESLQGFSDDVADVFNEETAKRIEEGLTDPRVRVLVDEDALREQIAGLADALPSSVRPIFAAQVESALEAVREGRIEAEELNRVITDRGLLLARNAAIRQRAVQQEEQQQERASAREQELEKQRRAAAEADRVLREQSLRMLEEELGLFSRRIAKKRQELELLILQGAEQEKINAAARELNELLDQRDQTGGLEFVGQDRFPDAFAPPRPPSLPEDRDEARQVEGLSEEVRGEMSQVVGEGGPLDDMASLLEEAAIPAIDEFAGQLGIGTGAVANFLDALLTGIADQFGGSGGIGGLAAQLAGAFAGGFQRGGFIPPGKIGLVHEGEALVPGPTGVVPRDRGGGRSLTVNVNTEIRALDARGVDRVLREGGQQAIVDAVLEATRQSSGVSAGIVMGTG